MISKEKQILEDLEVMLEALRSAKPEERSELSRAYAVVITEFEKVVAYFEKYVVGE